MSRSRDIQAPVTTVRIALANVRPGRSPDDALGVAAAAIADAGRQGAAVVCFPECYLPGYRWHDGAVPPPDQAYLDRAWTQVGEAAEAAGVGVVMGTERIAQGRPVPSALVVDASGRVLGFQDKEQIDPAEERTYAAGSGRHVFTTGGLTFGVAICHEGWRYPETVRWAAKRGAHLVFHPHAHVAEPGSYRPTTFADPANTFHEKALLCRAAENTIYIASVNAATPGCGTTSVVVRPDGTVLCHQPYGQEGVLVADLDLGAATGLLASRCRY